MNPEDAPAGPLVHELEELRRKLDQTEALLQNCQKASARIRESEERFRTMVHAVEDYAIFMLDVQGNIVSWNQGAQSIMGYDPQDVLGRHFSILYPEEDIRGGRPQRVLQAAIEDGPVADERWLVRRDGTKFWGDCVITALHDEAGTLKGFTKVTRDLSERRRIEEQRDEAMKAKEVLLREIHHRVRNNLQVMSSLLRLQSRYVRDETVLGVLHDSQSRIQSMAIVHQLLYESGDLGRVSRRQYLSRIVRHLYHSLGVSPNRIVLNLQIEDAACTMETAVPLGLVVNELVSNCLEHAFPEGRSGEIAVSVRHVGEDEFELVVADDGVGMSNDIDLQTPGTFGLYLVTTLATQLQGTTTFHRDKGLEVHLRFKDRDPPSRSIS